MPEPLSATDRDCLNLRWADAFLRGLCSTGVRRLVLSPGSRSTPVVQAAESCAGLALHTVLDERSAAFFALGLARASRTPVALLATSGSAPAHWYPALIEADMWGTPLVLISADRPPELHGWGANQTTDQQHLFGSHVRAFHDPGPPHADQHSLRAVHALGYRAGITSQWPEQGPVHVNLPFREPLVSTRAPAESSVGASTPNWQAPHLEAAPAVVDTALERMRTGRGLILCGPGDYLGDLPEQLASLAEAWDLPLLADPLSGLRWGTSGHASLTRYDSFLRNPLLARRLRPDWVLGFGRLPVSKTLNEHLADCDRLQVDPQGRWHDNSLAGPLFLQADPHTLCAQLAGKAPPSADARWGALWSAAEARTDALAQDFLQRSPWFEGRALHTLLGVLPAGTPLLIGNSLPVRQLDTWSGSGPVRWRAYGNRGVSGIDGQVSTLAGIASEHGNAVGVIGDLALLHDLGGLQTARGCRLTLLVINNGGGGIFDYLPQRRLATFEANWRTPQDIDLADAARLFGLDYHRVQDAQSLDGVLSAGLDGPGARLIEVVVDPGQSRDTAETWWRQMAADPELTHLDLLPGTTHEQ